MVQVKVNEGVVEGDILKGSLGCSYYSFKGIPYARPPTGKLRFKAPQPPLPWSGIRSAKEHGPVCSQYDMFTQTMIPGSEDCLYLNVYSPQIKPKIQLPVMVWIHGGAFISGSGNSDFYGPDFFMEQGNVILVTFNYRLEVLGFLCLDSEEIPGNAGMKDQVAALRWVKNNINNFGGDSENVTIFGESAGGACVSYHLVSPMSKGLFNRAIAQSGSCLSHWAQSFEPRERAFALARKLGFESENISELEEFFMNVPLESLVLKFAPITIVEECGANINLHYTIADEKQFGHNERFFYGDIHNVLKNGIHEGVKVMAGYLLDEGYVNLGLVPFKDVLTRFNKFIQLFCPSALALKLPITDQLKVGRAVKEYFYGNQLKISKDKIRPLVRYFSLNIFTYDIINMMKSIAKRNKNDTYLYKFTFPSERNIMVRQVGAQEAVNEADEPIVCHVDELMYLFDNKIANIPVNEKLESYQMILKMVRLWTNFAQYGNPTPNDSLGVKWTKFSVAEEEYLDIGTELKIETAPDKADRAFWESIYRRYYPKYFDD